ncbi:sensor histidine kinase [Algibacillus agarilyticus]|uniref:sensor histidine kinase n=1 Tax=Algibacillus agarilyticus TaxID=2234133 RepID=UPI000DD06700|nr:histidine kinase [Algibacillus agarilyticus]
MSWADKWHNFIDDRERLFWFLQTSGWVGYCLVHYLGSLLHEMRDIFWVVIMMSAGAGWFLTLPLRYIFQSVWNKAPWKIILTILLSSYVIGSIWAVVKNFWYWEIYKYGYRPDAWVHYFSNATWSFYNILCWSGLYFGIKYYQLLQLERQKALQATTMAHQAQLKMLRYQLNPHFLFNTLNAISTLVLMQENKTANNMVTRLSDFLRYSLDSDPIKKVELSQEVQALKLYLDIEKVRFEDRLQVNWDIEPSCKDALVPSLLLQPLIENSIKYGVSQLIDGGTITVSAKQHQNQLWLELMDNGPGTPISKGQFVRQGGVGIPNIRDRLLSLYDNDHSFEIENNKPTGVKVTIKMPLEYTRNSDE